MKTCICGGKLEAQNEYGNIRIFQCEDCHRRSTEKIKRKERQEPNSQYDEDLQEMGYRPRRK